MAERPSHECQDDSETWKLNVRDFTVQLRQIEGRETIE
jgi:hypothetical protein